MNFLFDDPFEPIREGPVEVRFEKSGGKLKAIYTIDFAKTDLNATKAADIQKAIAAILRTGLGVELSKLK